MTGRTPRKAGQLRSLPPEPLSQVAAHIDFPVVGLGASAGGLDAFKKLFDALPATCGMAFVLIQHLDPKHQSLMADLLATHTSLKVLQAEHGMPVERDHVYLIPPGRYLAIEDGSLRLSIPPDRHGARMPFDFFLRSLAGECGNRAICAVLSGSGSDGSLGLKAVKEKGGLVIVQDPEDAAFDGMPRSAIMTGDADFILSVAKIPAALIGYVGEAYLTTPRKAVAPPDAVGEALPEVIDLLAAQTTQDFSLYKQGTLRRRIERRMAMAGIPSGAKYLQTLREDAGELTQLAKDLLINVTHFFRDPGAFDELAVNIIPELVQRQTLDRPLRIWVPGCSTGEEAYSITMLFLEQIAAAKRNIKLQVFASDVDADCVAVARNGIYPDSIEADVSPTRLARFFTRHDHGYQVVRELRESVVFTRQNLLSDPPYSRLDLISCRNLLIYLNSEAQHKILSLFHFALLEAGVLFLGSSETVATSTERFEPISKKYRIYRHVSRSQPGEVAFPQGVRDAGRVASNSQSLPSVSRRLGFGELSQRTLLDAYAPASVLINARNEALYYSGASDRYLKLATGEDTRDVLTLAREGLRAKLRTAIQRAQKDNTSITVTGAHVSRDGSPVGVSMTVIPLEGDGAGLFLVSFWDEAVRQPKRQSHVEVTTDLPRVAELEQELESTRADLHSAIRDLELANEEQKTVNEEAMSVNEEFQSTNEELETSKEELQSLNEELSALNSQLQETVEQQRATSNDLQNILTSTDMATLFLDMSFNIRFFTPAARSLFNVIASDVGRPLADFTRRFVDPDLIADARSVLANRAPIQREIKTDDGRWFKRRMLPYLGDHNAVNGVVMTFAGISEGKANEHEIEAARAYLDSIIATIRQPLVVLDEELRVVSASSSFYREVSVSSEDLVGKKLLAAVKPLDVSTFRKLLSSIQADGMPINDQEVEIEMPMTGRRLVSLSGRVIEEEDKTRRKILLTFVDITSARSEGDALVAAKQEAERANLAKSRFLAAASHDLRQPLQTMTLLQGLLEKRAHDEATIKLVRRLDEAVSTMAGMLDKLLDINQLEAGIVRAEIVDFPIQRLLDTMNTEFAVHAVTNRLAWHVIANSLNVRSDPGLLEQIMRNLLVNAVKYTPEGKLLLGCRRRGDKLRIEVWDSGTGIPEHDLKAIFEEFHQLDNPARERSKGLGLGLAIVKRVADLLGHKVDVRSRLGSGSVFSVEVPLAGTDGFIPVMPSPAETPSNTNTRGTILIVEDDPAVRDMLQLLFEGEGHVTRVAADGYKALELAAPHDNAPDLIIADYNLPLGMSGLDVIKRLQAHYGHARGADGATKIPPAFNRTIPAIILTGDISTASLREIAGQGCVHLNKPVKANELIGIAQELLRQTARPEATRGAEFARVVKSPKPAETRSASTVFVVDDDRVIRETMRDLLAGNGYAVEIFADGPAFLAALRPGCTGCLLVDAVMPQMSGLELMDRLKREGHHLPAIMITGHGEVSMAVQAMKAGAADFIEKPVGPQELLDSIERILDQARNADTRSALHETAALRIACLTTRQQQILDMVLAGHPSKNIAADLGISQRTVDNHRAAIMKKTGSKSLPELIRTALSAA